MKLSQSGWQLICTTTDFDYVSELTGGATEMMEDVILKLKKIENVFKAKMAGKDAVIFQLAAVCGSLRGSIATTTE